MEDQGVEHVVVVVVVVGEREWIAKQQSCFVDIYIKLD